MNDKFQSVLISGHVKDIPLLRYSYFALYQLPKRSVRCIEVVRFSEGPLLEVYSNINYLHLIIGLKLIELVILVAQKVLRVNILAHTHHLCCV